MDKDGAIQDYIYDRGTDKAVRDHIEIPINGEMAGNVTFKIFPIISTMQVTRFNTSFNPYVVDVLFSEIKLSVDRYGAVIEDYRSNKILDDTSTNVYAKRLSTRYRTIEKSIDTSIATILFNNDFDNALRDPVSGRLVESVPVGGVNVRPEIRLLSKMEAYYKRPMSIKSLEVRDWVRNLVRITGYDGKTYLPLAESRNWGTGVSTIQCFECPE